MTDTPLPTEELDEQTINAGLRELEELVELRNKRYAGNWLARYAPYPKQREFHREGARYRERLLIAASRFGKSVGGAAETAFHVTGKYPSWWEGRRFDRPVRAWAAGVTNESTRDVVQAKLIGPPSMVEKWGTGAIPAEDILDTDLARSIMGALDTVVVKHVSGGVSTLQFKSYEKGREKWQGVPLEVLWMDEEPPLDIYMEGLTRTNETGGIVYITFTPLKGHSDVVLRFLAGPHPNRSVVTATIDDALHFTQAERDEIYESYADRPHEREARTKGVPALGSGRVFPVPESDIICEPIDIPDWWPRIGALDFGWDHPFAAVELAWDRDADVVYVTKEYRQRESTPIMHVGALKPWGDIPWAWPHDGLAHDKGSGVQLAEQYREHGLDMLAERATFQDGSHGVEAGITQMLERMQTGRWKVFRHLGSWLEEFRNYHRDDGKIVKRQDDLMDAARCGLMMLRHARTITGRTKVPKPKNDWVV